MGPKLATLAAAIATEKGRSVMPNAPVVPGPGSTSTRSASRVWVRSRPIVLSPSWPEPSLTTDPVGERQLSTVVEWLTAHAGLDFSGARRKWLREFLEAANTVDDGWLPQLLAGDEQSVNDLVDAATVQESYFFREPTTLDFLRREVLPGLEGDHAATRPQVVVVGHPRASVRRQLDGVPDGRCRRGGTGPSNGDDRPAALVDHLLEPGEAHGRQRGPPEGPGDGVEMPADHRATDHDVAVDRPRLAEPRRAVRRRGDPVPGTRRARQLQRHGPRGARVVDDGPVRPGLVAADDEPVVEVDTADPVSTPTESPGITPGSSVRMTRIGARSHGDV